MFSVYILLGPTFQKGACNTPGGKSSLVIQLVPSVLSSSSWQWERENPGNKTVGDSVLLPQS